MVLLFFIILIILIFVNYIFKNDINENFSNKIIFYKKNILFNELKRDNDKYFSSFFDMDLKVRHVSNINEYYDILYNSLCEPDEIIINKIKDYIFKIKNIIKMQIEKLKRKNKNIYELRYKYVNLEKFNELKWKIGFVCNNNYENGLPHTRDDIIILNKNKVMINSDNKNIKTLIHEQIHIYQKKYPSEVIYYLKEMNFNRIKKRTKYDNIRANPDLDDYIYNDNDGNTYMAKYINNANSIEDIIYYPYNKQLYEHPNERMAIEFENIINE
jgi:hypothetical protein